MGTADAERGDALVDGPVGLPLVRAAAALRWTRPDLTATLAELALDGAADAVTWVTAAGWLLHGRAALGDGRDTASNLLDGLGRWGELGVELMAGPAGRRLRVELAGPARRVGEAAAAGALLAAEPGVDDLDPDRRADVRTEVARAAVDDAPDRADDALVAAEQAWQEAGCAPGLATVDLLRAVRSRRAGAPDDAVTAAVAGLGRLTAGGRRAGTTAADHVAAALTTEWITALVEGGRLDAARTEAVPAAVRLLTTARTGRQVADLRLAVARVTAATGPPDAVLACLEPAARDAADSDAPDVESACRSMLGELHEAAGRLDAALAEVRSAMAAERRDGERGARLRAALVAPSAAWTRRPTGRPVAPATRPADGDRDGPLAGAQPVPADDRADDVPEPVPDLRPPDAPEPVPGDRPDPVTSTVTSTVAERSVAPVAGGGRRARRLAAEALAEQLAAGSAGTPGHEPVDGPARRHDPEPDGSPGPRGDDAGAGRGDGARDRRRSAEPGARDDRVSATSRLTAADGWTPGSGSLIGDALLRELGHDDEPAGDELFGRRGSAAAGLDGTDGSDDGASALDPHTARWDGSTWAGRPRAGDDAVGDTVVLDAWDGGTPRSRPAARPRTGPAADEPRRHTPGGHGTGDHGTGDPGTGDRGPRDTHRDHGHRAHGHRDRRRDDNGFDDRGLDDRGIRDRGLDDHGLDDRGLDDHGLRDRGLDDRGLGGHGLDDRGLDDHGLGDRGLGDHRLDDRGLGDRGHDDHGHDDHGLDDHGLGDHAHRARHADPTATVQYARSREASPRPGRRGDVGPDRHPSADGRDPDGRATAAGRPAADRNGSAPNGTNGAAPHGSATAAARDAAFGRGGPRRGAGRPRPADADGPGLGDLLADALAAYRNL